MNKQLICNKSGKFSYCNQCPHGKEHEEFFDNKNIPCKSLTCYDGKKFYNVKCIDYLNKKK